jgi:hypothetical protein
VKKRDVQEIDVSFIALEVITLAEDLRREDVIFGSSQELEVRERRSITGTQVSEYHPGPLYAPVCRMTNGAFILPATWLSRLVQAAAEAIVKPAVIDASQAAVFHSAIAQVGATVGAVKTQ